MKAAESPAAQPLTEQEVEAWLNARAVPGSRDVSRVEPVPEAPPLPPRYRGFAIEGSVGAFGHVNAMKNISPVAPWFHLKLGYEFTDWLMVFASGDIAIANTSYAAPPPAPRSYVYYGFSGGLRLGLKLSQLFGGFVQGELGAGRASEDILEAYGFTDADNLSPFFGGGLGLEWYPVNPHYTVVAHGGVRYYAEGFERRLSSEPPLAWISGVALRYTF